MLPNSEWSNPYPTDNNAEYWRDVYNNRDMNRVTYDPTASDAEVKISGLNLLVYHLNNHNNQKQQWQRRFWCKGG